MFGNGVTEKGKTAAVIAAVSAYVILVGLYLLPVEIPFKIAFPVAVLAIASLWVLPWQMSLALIASMCGDCCGAAGNFAGQIECFAVAHLFLIMFFVQNWFRDFSALVRAGGRVPETRLFWLIVYGVISLGALVFAMVAIIPEVPKGALRAGIALYSVIICMMLFTALVKHSKVYASAAGLFVLADALIAWNAFVEPVPGEKYLIMLPYYAAQLMFFLRASHLARPWYNQSSND